MADINELLGGLLSDPDSADKMRRIAAMFMTDGEETDQAEEAPSVGGGLSGLLGSLGGGLGGGEGGGGEMASLLFKAMPLISQYADGESDPKVQLLYALRPYLTGDRKDRLEDAVLFLKLSRMIGPAKEVFDL